MKTFTPFIAVFCIIIFARSLAAQTDAASPAVASSPVAAPATTGQGPDAEMMKQMLEMGKLNENHKLLSSLDGNWTYKIRFWMNGDPSSKPQESSGTAV